MKTINCPMLASQIGEVVDIHLAAFPNFFLSFLGEKFLKEFYTGVIEDPSGIAHVLLADQELVGFVAGSTRPNGFYSRLIKKRWWKFGAAALPALIRKPKIIGRLFRAFSMPNEDLPHPNCGTLMSIAVRPGLQSKGAGSRLVRAFLDEARLRGLAAVNLQTDAVGNDAVNQFYKKMGFKLFRTYTTPEGRAMNEYVVYLDQTECE